MQPHLEKVFSKFLSAYRANHGCHSVLEYTTEVWKRALDDKLYVGVLMTDLSKAFDCLPYNLMLQKLSHYKFTDRATNLLESYLCNRFQRVKVCQNVSTWKELRKGVPQGSIIGPQCFNVYINDLLFTLENSGVIPCNYADDNSLSVIGKNKDEVLKQMKEIIKVLVVWFKDNSMKLNVDKFQFMLLCPNREENNVVYTIQYDSIVIESQTETKLLGIYIDKDLSFSNHILKICRKANAKLHILKRLTKYLTQDCKLSILRCFILSQFIYCSALFHFCTKYYKTRMEKILYKGLRFVYEDYTSSYEDLLLKANMDSIDLNREKTILCEMYKCLNKQGPLYLTELFDVNQRSSRRGQTFIIPRVNTTTHGLHSIRYQGPRLWNMLSLELKSQPTLAKFKHELNNYSGNECKCAQCK